MEHLGWRMAGGSLAERRDAHQRGGADSCAQELAALVEHALLDHPVRSE
jgi:hypothetical protein